MNGIHYGSGLKPFWIGLFRWWICSPPYRKWKWWENGRKWWPDSSDFRQKRYIRERSRRRGIFCRCYWIKTIACYPRTRSYSLWTAWRVRRIYVVFFLYSKLSIFIVFCLGSFFLVSCRQRKYYETLRFEVESKNQLELRRLVSQIESRDTEISSLHHNLDGLQREVRSLERKLHSATEHLNSRKVDHELLGIRLLTLKEDEEHYLKESSRLETELSPEILVRCLIFSPFVAFHVQHSYFTNAFSFWSTRYILTLRDYRLRCVFFLRYCLLTCIHMIVLDSSLSACNLSSCFHKGEIHCSSKLKICDLNSCNAWKIPNPTSRRLYGTATSEIWSTW